MKDELDSDWLVQAEDTRDGYLETMRRLRTDQKERERLGRLANAHAREHWAPEVMEAKVAEIYLPVMQNSGFRATD